MSPEDPEALKVLAVVYLRRGETARAQELVRRALARDPLDGEARMLQAELEGLNALPREHGDLLARVRPVLRPASFRLRAPMALARPGPAGLRVFYVLDDPELLRYLPASLCVPSSAVHGAAWENLNKHPALVQPVELLGENLSLSEKPTGLWALAEGDGHDAARLLCPAQWRRLAEHAGPGPFRVNLGRRELTLLCVEADAEASAQLASWEAAPDGISGAFQLREGALTRVD